MAKTFAALAKGNGELSGSDRVSSLMKSGKSGSVAVRRRAEDRKPLFVLNITIDPDGNFFGQTRQGGHDIKIRVTAGSCSMSRAVLSGLKRRQLM